MIKAIATRYAGTMFRSRLEAKWAAFFDIVGWRWEYEPIDLAGWIPDFMIFGANQIFVEIKPFCDPNEILVKNTQNKIDLAMQSMMNQEVLLLGATVGWLSYGLPVLGIIGEWYEEGKLDNINISAEIWWQNAIIQRDGCDFYAEQGSYKHRISGEYDGDHHLDGTTLNQLLRVWREAGNRVQWNR